MRNLKLEIEYDGTNYCGWQVQNCAKSKPSIQQTIESALQKILQEKIKLIGSGRTDAGVHALAQVANFRTKNTITVEKLKGALNGNLPQDISIHRITEVAADFNSRFSAKSKIYRYTILNRPHSSPLLRNRVYFVKYPLDLKLMRSEAKALLGRKNFKSFQSTSAKEKNPVRRIKSIKIAGEKGLVHIEIEADSFVYNMVRNIVGTLVDIGRGKFKKGELKRILLARNRRAAGPNAPAQGLVLVKVKY